MRVRDMKTMIDASDSPLPTKCPPETCKKGWNKCGETWSLDEMKKVTRDDTYERG
jgi:hypothetical protein